ncbi:MAG: dephospho-CoA kinase [Nitrospinae bacterium]|nr:dephospho-CoA kinase [Nitrospinota bacterium]
MALLVGLTGSMGSGKSLAASILQGLGARVLDADKICRDLVQPCSPAWREIAGYFGRDVLREDQSIDRPRLAAIVFEDPRKREALEAILHPRVIAEERRLFEEIRQQDPGAVVVVDAALLIESGNYKNMDRVAVVGADEGTQVQRLLRKGLWTRDEILKRIRSQMSLEEKKKKAHFFIPNDTTVEDLKKRLETLYNELKVLA